MCLHAGDVLNHHAAGPYRESDARAYARAVLIPAELLDPGPRMLVDVPATAHWLGVPASELELEMTGADGGGRPRRRSQCDDRRFCRQRRSRRSA
jgi:hypothetical protein